MRLLRHPAFLAVALGHLGVDILNGQLGVLLAALSTPLGINNATLGLIATFYQVVGALAQPVFGWASDRFGGRWTTAGGVLWMAGFYSLFALAPGYGAIACLVLAALGSAAFHPPGANKAAQIGHAHMAGQTATAASLFFLFGQGGLSVGPALGGFMLDYFDRAGVLFIALLVVPIGLFAAWQLRPPAPAILNRGPARGHLQQETDPQGLHQRPARPALVFFILVLVLAGLRTWAQMAVTTFVPKHLHDSGFSATEYGLVVALFMGGSALGGVLSAVLGDRWGRGRIITLTLSFSVVPFLFLPFVNGVLLYGLAAIAGFFNGGPHSILVTMAQKALPGRGGLASGVALGSMFASGAIGAYVTGQIADAVGLPAALQFNAVLAAVTALLSLLLVFEKRPLAAAVVTGN
jgi:FSR family fosmidomycin resistance protein-like MFS transporter